MDGATLDTCFKVILGIRQDMKQLAKEMSNMNEKFHIVDCEFERMDGRIANTMEHLKASYPIPRLQVQNPSKLPNMT